MSQKFQRTIEDFECENCRHKVVGSGYTNHCPRCLLSKHVDINPGDRAKSCGGLMQPIQIETKNKQYMIVHRCRKCGAVKRNKIASDDDMDEVIRIAGRQVDVA